MEQASAEQAEGVRRVYNDAGIVKPIIANALKSGAKRFVRAAMSEGMKKQVVQDGDADEQ